MAVYPPQALAAGLSGRGTLYCRVTPDGRMEACDIGSEEPADAGFGEAALRLAPLFRMDVGTMYKEGAPIRIPMRFEAPSPVGQAVRFAPNEGQYRNLGPAGPYYPEIAVQKRLQGIALIDCAVRAGGQLKACRLVEESPKRAYFGPAALRMAQTGWITADPASGETPAGEVRRFVVPFQFARP